MDVGMAEEAIISFQKEVKSFFWQNKYIFQKISF